jgi:glyceraldehyde 3-phosphate dehydrogenase
MIKVGINGFGRIGRAIFRNNLNKNYFKVVAINEINPDTKNIAYTLNFDTLYDRLPNLYRAEHDHLISNTGDRIKVFHHESIHEVNWDALGVDFIIDASGIYQNVRHAQEMIKEKIISKVFITHSPDKVDFTMVLGANEKEFDVDNHHVISTSICDATALAPVLKVISNKYGIEFGYITTLHPWLNYQNLMDGPASSWSVPGEIYHHYALGRSAIGNMIPKPTSAISATCKVLKKENISEEMIGSFSYRPPTAIVGSADITLKIKKNIKVEEVISVFEEIEKKQRFSIFHNNWEPLVSLDFKKTEYSAIIDHRWTDIIKGSLLKLVLWYDNEWGYAARVLDQVKFVEQMMEKAKR